MTEAERHYFQEYVKEVFHYEHQCSTEILARVLLLCELLIEKGSNHRCRSGREISYSKCC